MPSCEPTGVSCGSCGVAAASSSSWRQARAAQRVRTGVSCCQDCRQHVDIQAYVDDLWEDNLRGDEPTDVDVPIVNRLERPVHGNVNSARYSNQQLYDAIF